jgi:hypothetical protein
MLILAALAGAVLFLVFTGFIVSLCIAAGRTAPSPHVQAAPRLSESGLRRLKAIRAPGSARRAG